MNPLKRLTSCFRSNQKEETSVAFLNNGGELLEELIASFDGRHRVPIASFSAQELIRATNDFADCVHLSENGYLFKGRLGDRPVLVKKFHDELISPRKLNGAINDIVITSDLLYYPSSDKFLPWKSRLKVAADIAYVIAYLHDAFPRPVIYKELRTDKVIIDQFGVTKLFDFSNSIMLPQGEFQVKDVLLGQCGSIDPEYTDSKIVNQKTDVYSIGLLLLNLLSGQQYIWPHPTEQIVCTTKIYKSCFERDRVKPSVDQKLIEEGNEVEMQLQDFLDLALRCIEEKGEERPDMMTVAKELWKIKKSGHHS